MNSIEALDEALSALHDRLKRLSNPDSIARVNRAMDTVIALRDTIADGPPTLAQQIAESEARVARETA